MARVYIVEEALRWDPETQSLRSAFDFRPASVYGDLVPLTTSRGPSILSPGPVVFELQKGLQNFSDEDYLLAVGDPVKIGIATAIAARVNQGRVRMLKWDRDARNYISVDFKL